MVAFRENGSEGGMVEINVEQDEENRRLNQWMCGGFYEQYACVRENKNVRLFWKWVSACVCLYHLYLFLVSFSLIFDDIFKKLKTEFPWRLWRFI